MKKKNNSKELEQTSFNWTTTEEKVKRSMKISPEEKMRKLHESLVFFNKIKQLKKK